MCMHDVSTFKAMQFAPLLNDFQKKFLGDPWQDREPCHQTVHEDCVDGVIKGGHTLRGHEFILWVYNEQSLD